MKSLPLKPSRKLKVAPIPGVVILAIVFVVCLWGIHYFGAEARVHRATARVVRTVEKTGEESPISLGLAANRLGKVLATDVVLALDGIGTLTTGRQETVQLFAQIRQSMKSMTFADPAITVAPVGPERMQARVVAHYRFDPGMGEATAGEGVAQLVWLKGKDGWQLVEVALQTEEGTVLPKGWR